MSTDEEKKDALPSQRPKRSSLKTANIMDANEILNYSKKKRNSVSFQLGGNFKYKELRAKFEDIKQEATNPIKKKNFLDARKKSIKNEFALVKEMLKNNKEVIEEDESESEELKENTDKNVKVGKEYEDSESDSRSQKSENENSDDKNNENEEKKKNENEEEKKEEKEEKEKKNDGKKGEENEDEESFEDDEIEVPKTNRQEKQELDNKRECNQLCKFC